MKSTVITHIYNESFLLPIWLRHHREHFDHGIVLDYNSTDDPESIVRDLTPDWSYTKVEIPDFNAITLDKLVSETEATVDGNRIALTITEFLLGDPRKANRRYYIPQILLINCDDNLAFDESKPFHHQVTTGTGSDTTQTPPWHARSMHQHPTTYGSDGSTTGRHYHACDNGEYLIYRVSHCLVTEEMIERRLQIQTKIPDADKANNFGVQHHNWGKGLKKDDVLGEQEQLRTQAVDLSDIINKYEIKEKS